MLVFLEGWFLSGVVVLMSCAEFSADVVSFMSSLGLSDLGEAGIRLPPEEWDWESCCRVCVLLVAMGHVLPGSLSSRMALGPVGPSVRLYSELMRIRGLAQK